MSKPCDINNLKGLDRIPCASLLVRIVKAPEKGDKVLSVSKVAPPHWPEVGLMVPAPAYETEAYNTHLYQVEPTEEALFVDKQRRNGDLKVAYFLREIQSTYGTIENMPDRQREWAETVLFQKTWGKLSEWAMNEYTEQFGIAIAVDQLLNTPGKKPELYSVFLSLNPPGDFYT